MNRSQLRSMEPISVNGRPWDELQSIGVTGGGGGCSTRCFSSHICTLCRSSVLQLIHLSLKWSILSQKILWELVHHQYQGGSS